MAKITIGLGVLLILLGVGAYASIMGSDQASVTALIPAFFGVVFVILGGVGAAKASLNKHMMHAALVLALLGAAGSARGLSGLGAAMSGEAERPLAVYAQSTMFVLCVLFIVLGIVSFVKARKAGAATAD